MNVLAAATINLIEELRKPLKGWTLTPLVQEITGELVHGRFVSAMRGPKEESPTEFFARYGVRQSCLIKCKSPKKPLRLLQITESSEKPYNYKVSYWKANGWRRDQSSNQRIWFTRSYPEYHPALDTMAVGQIVHIRRAPKHKPVYVIQPSFDVSDESSIPFVAPTIAAVLKKSFERGFKTQRIENMSQILAVNLDGKNFLFDPFRLNFKVIYS